MPNHIPEPPPSQEMPAATPPRTRKPAYLLVALGAALCLFLVLDRESFLHGMIYGTEPFSWDGLWALLARYGHWIFTLYILSTAVVLFLENRNPDRTLAWLLALALLPVAGLLLYWLVGPNFRYIEDRRRFRLPKARATIPRDVKVADISPLVQDTGQLMFRTTGARLLFSPGAVPLYDGAQAFARMKERLGKAEKYILLASYIIKNDRTGNAIKDILIERARAGVFVCVLYDAAGSWKIGKEFLGALRENGVHAYAFLPVAFPMFRGANYRNHRKIIVVDGETAYMGGMNIGDEYAGINPEYTYWRDTHLELDGEAVGVLRAFFTSDFASCCHDAALVEKVRALSDKEERRPVVSTPLQIIASGPDTPWDTIHKAYMSVISRSRKRLWMTSPYLVPGDALMESISMASLSGVDVRLILPGRADHILVHWASMNCIDELLRSGVRVFIYDAKGFVHAKTMVADGELLSIGSANLDTRSMSINFEVQAFLYDKTLAEEAERVFERDMEKSCELTFLSWRGRPKIDRIKENIGKLFASLL